MEALREFSAAMVANWRVLLVQWAGNAVLIALFGLWLQIPDSHLWQLVFSVILLSALAVAWLSMQCWSFRRFRADRLPAQRWLGWAVLAAFLVLLYILWMPADSIGNNAEVWSYYRYSKLSAHARHFFTYQRIGAAFTWLALLLRWWIIPASLLPFAMEAIARQLGAEPWRRGWRALMHWAYWLLTGASAAASIWAVRALIAWLPGHSPRQQVVSAVLRTAIAYSFAVAAWFVWMAAASATLSSSERRENTGRDPVV